MQNRPHSQQCPKFHNIQWLIECHRLLRSASLLFKKLQFYLSWPIQFSTKFSWSHAPASDCVNGTRPQCFTLTWKLPHGRYSPAKHHVSEVHLIGYASYLNKKSNLSSKLISRSKKLTSEQASWIFLKNYLGILRPGSNCSQVWHQNHIRVINFSNITLMFFPTEPIENVTVWKFCDKSGSPKSIVRDVGRKQLLLCMSVSN